MNRVHRLCIPTVAAALLVAGTATAGSHPGFIDLRDAAPVHGDAAAGHAKATRCGGCHGANGIAPVPIFPNLAGQKIDYLYWQLVEIQHEARPESPMTSQIGELDHATLRDLAAYFASLPPPPGSGATNEATARGAAIYRDGDPAHGTPPCQGCHGANGDGRLAGADAARERAYPRLRGQHAQYIVQRLKDLAAGKHVSSSSDFVMSPVARTLDEASMQAVAQWLESGAE